MQKITELKNLAKTYKIKGYSKMNKKELIKALSLYHFQNYNLALPKDILLEISLMLDCNSLLSLGRTCKTTCRFILNNDDFWKLKTKRDYPFLKEPMKKDTQLWKEFYKDILVIDPNMDICNSIINVKAFRKSGYKIKGIDSFDIFIEDSQLPIYKYDPINQLIVVRYYTKRLTIAKITPPPQNYNRYALSPLTISKYKCKVGTFYLTEDMAKRLSNIN